MQDIFNYVFFEYAPFAHNFAGWYGAVLHKGKSRNLPYLQSFLRSFKDNMLGAFSSIIKPSFQVY